jgi:hypothetical protein
LIVLKGLINILEHDLRLPTRYKQRHPHVKVVMCSRSTLNTEAKVFEEFPALDGIARGEVDAFAKDLAEHPDLSGNIRGLSVPGKPASLVEWSGSFAPIDEDFSWMEDTCARMYLPCHWMMRVNGKNFL